jgi:hypothetical protein
MKTVSVAYIKRLIKCLEKERKKSETPCGVTFFDGAIFACKQLLEFGVDKKAKK